MLFEMLWVVMPNHFMDYYTLLLSLTFLASFTVNMSLTSIYFYQDLQSRWQLTKKYNIMTIGALLVYGLCISCTASDFARRVYHHAPVRD